MFGLDHSYSAEKTLTLLKENNLSNIVELGAGLGRDTIFFGKNSINVIALDYSKKGLSIIDKKINNQNLNSSIRTLKFDVRKKLPFKDNSIEACYSHMLYCMALTNLELTSLNSEVKRILKPGGLNIYTVRNTEDGDFKKGVHMIAPRAADLIMEAVVAMEYRASAEDIARICHPHPTYSEAVKEAALSATAERPLHI